uniref:Putative secreted protein n=1 Tax=Anopheles marajoara TaxID=58244 RepID=A0A2M4C837_9DIPT
MRMIVTPCHSPLLTLATPFFPVHFSYGKKALRGVWWWYATCCTTTGDWPRSPRHCAAPMSIVQPRKEERGWFWWFRWPDARWYMYVYGRTLHQPTVARHVVARHRAI